MKNGLLSGAGGLELTTYYGSYLIVVVVVFVTVFISFNMQITPSVNANLSKLVVVIVFI